MDSMFDRLGDLLSGALDEKPMPQSDFFSDEKPEANRIFEDEKEAIQQENEESPYFFVPYHIKDDFVLLGITGAKTTEDEIKSAYREKIKFFHPDKQKDIPILQKIATDRTAKIVEAYNRITDWLSNREAL